METERKKQKGINPNHWMCRIQKTVFNIDAPSFYMGYCPFFWMTWVAIVAFIPAMIWRYTVIPLGNLIWKFAGGGISIIGSKVENKISDVCWYLGLQDTICLADDRTIDLLRKFQFYKYSPYKIDNPVWYEAYLILDKFEVRVF
jgi:hypothetical protein